MSENETSIKDIRGPKVDLEDMDKRLHAVKEENGEIRDIEDFFRGIPDDRLHWVAKEFHRLGYRIDKDLRRLVAPENGNDKIKK